MQLLTRLEAAKVLKVSAATVHRMRMSGQLPCVHVRGRVLFSTRDIEALIERNRRAGR
jgi:excisionase family DNA binding protein